MAVPPVAPALGWPGSAGRGASGLGWPDGEPQQPVAPTPPPGPSATPGESAVSRETSGSPGGPEGSQPAGRGRSLGRLPHPPTSRVLALANQKGGVGKTTSAVNLAAALALHDLRVLVVDLDPQGNASTALGIDHHAGIPSVYDVLTRGRALEEIIVPCREIPGLACAPATIDLAGADIELVSVVAREVRLRRALAGYLSTVETPPDYVFIDCPPSLGLLTVNALVAAGEVLIPVQCEYYALEGLSQLLRTIELVRGELNPALDVSTILLTMYDARTKLADAVADDVRGHFGDRVLGSVIPRSVRISEAPGFGQSILTYDPGSRGAAAYVAAARQLAHQVDRTEVSA